MKSIKFFVLIACAVLTTAVMYAESPRFQDYFEAETMRVDVYHTADKTSEIFTLDAVYKQGPWSGNPNSLLTPFQQGMYFIKVYDKESGKLIFSNCYNSYCSEYITTDPAAKGVKRTYHETALIPFPKNAVVFTLERRDRKYKLHKIFSLVIDPAAIYIRKDARAENVTVMKVQESGAPNEKVDLAFVAEGYTEAEKNKFREDVVRMTDELFKREPYKTHRKDFNIYGLFKPSQGSGPDEPRSGIYKNTAVGATFNSLNLSRYMLTEENRALQNIAAHAPCDSLLIMVNTSRYGGGGIYNFYCIFAADNDRAPYLMLHEFGHSFCGLADEYYGSSVSYNDFYPPGIEPLDPNITALLKPGELKWKHLVKKDTPLPTPWGKEKFDKMGRRDQREYMKQAWEKEFKDVVGAFEGAGYSSKGLYRPMLNCLMFTSGELFYCRVCEDAVIQTIKYYTGK